MLKAAQTAWAITVATATPTTPQPKLMTNQRSSTVFSPALTKRKYMLARESPTARSMPATAFVHILEDEPHGVDGEILNRVLPAGLVGDAHEPHDQQPRAQGAEERERRAYRGLGYEQRARRAAELMLPARAVELRYEDAAAIRKAQGYGQEEEDERGAGAHRGEHRVAYRLRLAAVAADHYAVHRVV